MRREWRKEGERKKIKSFKDQLDEADFFPPFKKVQRSTEKVSTQKSLFIHSRSEWDGESFARLIIDFSPKKCLSRWKWIGTFFDDIIWKSF